MRYKLLTTPRFEKDFKKLDKSIRQRVLKKIKNLEMKPYSFKSLHGKLKGKYSLHVGDYRVIYVINEKEKKVILLTVDHRGRIYKRFELIQIKQISK
jgi:mRNA interferase RelE/StbE